MHCDLPYVLFNFSHFEFRSSFTANGFQISFPHDLKLLPSNICDSENAETLTCRVLCSGAHLAA